MGAHRTERSAREKWMAQRKVAAQEQELEMRYVAVSQTLDRFCDCVVHLGPPPDFKILEPNPRLAALLLYADGRTLEGSSIFNYTASEEDRTRILKAFEDSIHGDASGGMINVRFRDTHAREFGVTASHTCMRRFEEDEAHFIVGIAEPAERMPILKNSTEDGLDGVAFSVDPWCTRPGAQATTSSTVPITEWISTSSWTNMWVHFTAIDLKVVRSSSSFGMFCRPCSPGIYISKWLHPDKNRSFYRDYTSVVNDLVHSKLDKTTIHQKWLLRSHGCEIRADVAITVKRSDTEDAGMSGDMVAYAVLTNVQEKENRPRSLGSGSSRSFQGTRGDLVATAIGQSGGEHCEGHSAPTEASI